MDTQTDCSIAKEIHNTMDGSLARESWPERWIEIGRQIVSSFLRLINLDKLH